LNTGNNVKQKTKTGDHVIFHLPSTVDKKQFAQTLEALENFLTSEQADALKGRVALALQTEIDEAYQLEYKAGWKKLREYLSTAADVLTLASPFLYSVFPRL